MKIKVIIKEPGKEPETKTIRNDLETMQKIVGGYIQALPIASDLAVICNEEGRLLNLPYNLDICGASFCGTIILAGTSEDEFCDIPEERTVRRLILRESV